MLIAIIVLIIFLVGGLIGFTIGSTRRPKPTKSAEQEANEYYISLVNKALELTTSDPAASIQTFEAAKLFFEVRLAPRKELPNG